MSAMSVLRKGIEHAPACHERRSDASRPSRTPGAEPMNHPVSGLLRMPPSGMTGSDGRFPAGCGKGRSLPVPFRLIATEFAAKMTRT